MKKSKMKKILFKAQDAIDDMEMVADIVTTDNNQLECQVENLRKKNKKLIDRSKRDLCGYQVEKNALLQHVKHLEDQLRQTIDQLKDSVIRENSNAKFIRKVLDAA